MVRQSCHVVMVIGVGVPQTDSEGLGEEGRRDVSCDHQAVMTLHKEMMI